MEAKKLRKAGKFKNLLPPPWTSLQSVLLQDLESAPFPTSSRTLSPILFSTRYENVEEFHIDQQHVVESAAPKRISAITFSLFSPHDILRISNLQVVNRGLYQLRTHEPTSNGVLDPRLGTSSKLTTCATCGDNMSECVGHFGFIKLELPVFHIGYFKAVLHILQMICKSCSRVMLTTGERDEFLVRLRSSLVDTIARQKILKTVSEKAKRCSTCPSCGSHNGGVHKQGSHTQTLKIVHDVNKPKKSEAAEREKENEMKELLADAIQANSDVGEHWGKVQDNLNPLRVLELFSAIPPEDIELLGMDPARGRPEHLILTHLLVPPLCIRPSILVDAATGSNEDDLTMKLTEIIHINQLIKEHLEKGKTTSSFVDTWDFLQLHTAMYINSELPGMGTGVHTVSKPLRSLCQRLKGKQGRFRGNLSGKRVDFSSRTVISPDPNLSVDEVAVPIYICKTLTIPERVFAHNRDELRELIRKGPDVHPGANFVEFADGGKKFLRYANRDKIAKGLRHGDVVERHLRNGDIVLFNRQPSLHRMSIMAHKVRVNNCRTFQLNECVCTPYNADFDGDEMNLHVPQTEEARAEAATLLAVKHNLATPRNGSLIIAPIQDVITASYLLTAKDRFFSKAQFTQICSYMGLPNGRVELPMPAILRPVMLWTGKQIYTFILCPQKSSDILVSFESPSNSYSGEDKCMCKNDGYVCFRNSEFISGRLDKKTLGTGSKGSLCYVVFRDHGSDEAVTVMDRITRMCTRWMSNYGFSIGVDDVWPSARLEALKAELVEKGYMRCDNYIDQFKAGVLPPQPGCNLEETLESVLTGELSQIREEAGQVCLQELHRLNAPLVMARSGAKGSTLNISQMVGMVGQQSVGGQRIPNGFIDRALPHFEHGSKEPAARGFVRNSFFSGMEPSEFFFHTMGGREGLVDTAVKTAETGYMQRRLMKALEDLSCQYDGTVRSSTGGVIQFKYGEDGLDPFVMEGIDRPLDFCRVSMLIVKQGSNDSWGRDHMDEIEARIRQDSEQHGCSIKFIDDLVAYCRKSDAVARFSSDQFDLFVRQCFRKYVNALVQPGEGVGAVAAQSLGEPATQMTLKTFHFAGVASMNVTLGVPRIKEIINASKTISTPIITAGLLTDDDVSSARIVKGRIEKTCLGEVCSNICERIKHTLCYMEIQLDLELIQTLQLEITVAQVISAIYNTPKLKAGKGFVERRGDNFILVHPDPDQIVVPRRDKGEREKKKDEKKKETLVSFMQRMKTMLPNVIVSGIPTVSRAVISNKDRHPGKYELIVEGMGLREVMGISGIDSNHTKSNHILEAESALGIEAARRSIMDEIVYTMASHGIRLDIRHVMILADLMTHRGEVLGITRFGIGKMKESVLMLASFEKTTDHLFDAAVHGRRDSVVGVSECIILGMPIPLGTGLMGLTYSANKPDLPTPRSFLLDQDEYRDHFLVE